MVERFKKKMAEVVITKHRIMTLRKYNNPEIVFWANGRVGFSFFHVKINYTPGKENPQELNIELRGKKQDPKKLGMISEKIKEMKIEEEMREAFEKISKSRSGGGP